MINYSREWNKNSRLGDFGIKNPITNEITKSQRDKVRRKNKMATLREQASDYISPETRNISELKEVCTEMDLLEKTATTKDGKEFTYNYILVDGVEYRVPNMVLKQLKTQLEEKKDSTRFKVKSVGKGLNTEYTVIMLD